MWISHPQWAGLWDKWISHPPLHSHNHWQYVCNQLEETVVNGFYVHWKWQNIHVWKTSSSPRRGAHPEGALYPLPWILCKPVCTQLSGMVVHDIIGKRTWHCRRWLNKTRQTISHLTVCYKSCMVLVCAPRWLCPYSKELIPWCICTFLHLRHTCTKHTSFSHD